MWAEYIGIEEEGCVCNVIDKVLDPSADGTGPQV